MLVADEGKWYFDQSRGAWCLTKAGPRELGAIPEIELQISQERTEQLIAALDTTGWIKPRLDERLRAEDLKITNRLLDLLETKLPDGISR